MFRIIARIMGFVMDLILCVIFLAIVLFILFVAWSAGVEIWNGAGSSTRNKRN